MPRKKLRVVSPDEVRITRRGQVAEFEYADEAMGGMSLNLGRDVGGLSDEELIDKHNEVVAAMQATAAAYHHVAVEVPPGKPQLRYFELGGQWTPRGDVLRCLIDDGGPDGEVTIEIDDRQLSLREFGRLLSTYAGWGMRVVFVPDDELHEPPDIDVREPEDPADTVPGPAGEASIVAPPKSAPGKPARTWTHRDKLLLRLPVYRLRITLAGSEPPVWRSVLVSGNRSLKKLHGVIQAAMGWESSHLHLFTSTDRTTNFSDPAFGLDDARDESRTKLRSLARRAGDRFLYEYDLGDGWVHDIVVEEIVTPDTAGRLPRCVGGERACPPEDCGGIPGFADLVEAMRDASHPGRRDYLEWLGRPFDPDAFDIEEINRRLRRLR